MRFGINLIGIHSTQCGIAELGRKIAKMLATTSIPFVCLDMLLVDGGYRGEMPELSSEPIYSINIIVCNWNMLDYVIRKFGVDLFAQRYNIGLWCWELEHFPAPPSKITLLFHEIWTISDFCKKAISNTVHLPVTTIKFPMIPCTGSPVDIPSKFTVLFMFDLGSGAERKNPIDCIIAFLKAFGDSDDVQLIMKVNGSDSPYGHAIKEVIQDKKNIIYMTENLSYDQKWGLINQCDVYMSLHATEGLGLSPMEAMAAGKVVVATGYSGNLEYMTNDTSIPVPYEIVKIPDGTMVYSGMGSWAKPDTNIAARWLRILKDSPALRELIGKKAMSHISKNWSMDECTRQLVEAINSSARRALSFV